jgi:amino acid permease
MKHIASIFNALNKLARPYLTVMIATTFNLVCAWAAITEKITVIEYVTAVSPTNSMIIGFWFGERAALKVPGKSEEDR